MVNYETVSERGLFGSIIWNIRYIIASERAKERMDEDERIRDKMLRLKRIEDASPEQAYVLMQDELDQIREDYKSGLYNLAQLRGAKKMLQRKVTERKDGIAKYGKLIKGMQKQPRKAKQYALLVVNARRQIERMKVSLKEMTNQEKTFRSFLDQYPRIIEEKEMKIEDTKMKMFLGKTLEDFATIQEKSISALRKSDDVTIDAFAERADKKLYTAESKLETLSELAEQEVEGEMARLSTGELGAEIDAVLNEFGTTEKVIQK